MENFLWKRPASVWSGRQAAHTKKLQAEVTRTAVQLDYKLQARNELMAVHDVIDKWQSFLSTYFFFFYLFILHYYNMNSI